MLKCIIFIIVINSLHEAITVIIISTLQAEKLRLRKVEVTRLPCWQGPRPHIWEEVELDAELRWDGPKLYAKLPVHCLPCDNSSYYIKKKEKEIWLVPRFQNRGQQTFSESDSKYFSLVSHLQLCHHSINLAIEYGKQWVRLCSNQTSLTKTEGGPQGL